MVIKGQIYLNLSWKFQVCLSVYDILVPAGMKMG